MAEIRVGGTAVVATSGNALSLQNITGLGRASMNALYGHRGLQQANAWTQGENWFWTWNVGSGRGATSPTANDSSVWNNVLKFGMMASATSLLLRLRLRVGANPGNRTDLARINRKRGINESIITTIRNLTATTENRDTIISDIRAGDMIRIVLREHRGLAGNLSYPILESVSWGTAAGQLNYPVVLRSSHFR